MATIEELLRAFVKTGGAYAAAPKDTFTSYSVKSTVTSWGEIGRFTAPSNGYVRVETKSSGENSTVVVLANDQPLGGVAYPYSGLKLAVGSVQNFVSVRSWKGEGEISPPCFMT